MRLVIAEDNVLLAEGLQLILARHHVEVLRVVETADGLLAAVEECAPDAAIVDVRLPPSFRDEGLRAAIAVRRRREGFPILVLSQYIEQAYATELLSTGHHGVGYLLKDRVGRVAEFVDALRSVAAGGLALDAEVITQVVRRRDDPLEALTPREREVLGLMAEGLDNATIAARLRVSDNAVHKHIGHVFAKLGLAAGDPGHRRVLAVLTYLDALPR
ncbi:response regulator transcription factor [Streptomyces pactum]|uniref:Response regulator transcription factor n=1 Tax=Streptomyces pactum TaxID=68249 RepID=A0ABS0NSE6_9ACTN|nr:response regulator transcription factor [Streptomyces pactum]MBH5338120.1 response regulator transcription factor [Streptomyces pactum]